MSPTGVRRKAFELCKHLGIPTKSVKPDPFGWNGKFLATKGLRTDNLIHEITHWIVCAPSRRTKVDWGLGAGPETNLRRFEEKFNSIKTDKFYREVTDAYATYEESLASVLGIVIQYNLGDKHWDETFEIHSWDTFPDRFNYFLNILELSHVEKGVAHVLLQIGDNYQSIRKEFPWKESSTE